MDHTELPESAIEDVPDTGWDGFPKDPGTPGECKLAFNGKQSVWTWNPATDQTAGYWTEGTITCWPHEMRQYQYKGRVA